MLRLNFQTIFRTIPEFAECLMQNLSATYVNLIVDPSILNYKLSKNQKAKFLNPIRDIIKDTSWIKTQIKNGYAVVLAGRDTVKLLERIKNPIKYWKEGNEKDKLIIWMAIFPLTNPDHDLVTIKQNETITVQKIEKNNLVNWHVYAFSLRDQGKYLLTSKHLPLDTKLKVYQKTGYSTWLTTAESISDTITLLFYSSQHTENYDPCFEIESEDNDWLTSNFSTKRKPDIFIYGTKEIPNIELPYIHISLMDICTGVSSVSENYRHNEKNSLYITLGDPFSAQYIDVGFLTISLDSNSQNLISYSTIN